MSKKKKEEGRKWIIFTTSPLLQALVERLGIATQDAWQYKKAVALAAAATEAVMKGFQVGIIYSSESERWLGLYYGARKLAPISFLGTFGFEGAKRIEDPEALGLPEAFRGMFYCPPVDPPADLAGFLRAAGL